MTIVEMLEQSGVLTLLGMGVVFSFLVVLIICISLAGKFIHALGVDKDVLPLAAAAPRASAGSSNAGNGPAVTAAITAAVNEYRKTNA
jgi:oxaloacetate decarboxylase gamma subunit